MSVYHTRFQTLGFLTFCKLCILETLKVKVLYEKCNSLRKAQLSSTHISFILEEGLNRDIRNALVSVMQYAIIKQHCCLLMLECLDLCICLNF